MSQIQNQCPNSITLLLGKQEAHSTEAGTLDPVFEKSATELKSETKFT